MCEGIVSTAKQIGAYLNTSKDQMVVKTNVVMVILSALR